MKYVVQLLILLTIVSSASAQFEAGKFWLGPSFGVALPGGAFGGGLQGEYAINENFGVGLEMGYYAYRDETITDLPAPLNDIVLSNRYATISGLLFGTYHFMPGKQIDPYAKVGLGYKNVDLSIERNGATTPTPAGFSAATASGVDYLIQAGARYHFSEGFSARAAVGYPVVFSLGLDLATGGKSSGVAMDDSARKKARENQYAMYIGPYIIGKASLKSEVAEGWKTGIVFDLPPDFGVSIMFPFGTKTNIGFGLDLGHASYGYQFRPENNSADSITIIARYSYFNMFPHFNLGGFVIGMNFGFANGASTRTRLDTAASIVGTFTVDTNSSSRPVTYFPGDPTTGAGPLQYMAPLMEVRIGGAIPVVTSETGRLNVLIQAGYGLSGVFEDFRNYEGSYPIDGNQPPGVRIRTQPQESLNPHFISFGIGLAYHFRLGF